MLTTRFVRFASSEVALLVRAAGHRAARSDLLAGPRGQAASRSRDHAKEGSSAARGLDSSARPSNRLYPFPSPEPDPHKELAETRSAAFPITRGTAEFDGGGSDSWKLYTAAAAAAAAAASASACCALGGGRLRAVTVTTAPMRRYAASTMSACPIALPSK